MTVRIITGDCRDVLATFEADSIDACVTDPPYGLEFMGKEWDRLTRNIMRPESQADQERLERYGTKQIKGISRHPDIGAATKYGKQMQAWHETWAREVYRVLKPGAHVLAFGSTRTYHRLVCGIEDAGFEIRDSLLWITGQGFPKNHSVSKALDKAAGAEREITRIGQTKANEYAGKFDQATSTLRERRDEPATDLARQWDGWGTALKPAVEIICLARKPLIGSVAANVTAYGTGGLNIDGCRIPHRSDDDLAESEGKNQHTKYRNPGSNRDSYSGQMPPRTDYDGAAGRWPANALFDQAAADVLDAMSGERPVGGPGSASALQHGAVYGLGKKRRSEVGYGDSGGASRFFFVSREGDDVRFRYTAKADKRQRTQGGASGTHPTQKPIDLMSWLCRLICPPGGTVLDPFAGSGSTGVAADREGFNAILIEQDPSYAEDARRKVTGDAPLFAEVELV